MEEIIDHEKVRIEILKVLFNNQGEFLSVHQINKEMSEEYVFRNKDLLPYLVRLEDEKMVKKIIGKTDKIPGIGANSKPIISQSPDTYYLTPKGISYAESDFSLKPVSEITRIADGINKINDLLSLLVDQSKLSNEEQTRQNELLEELRKALHDEKGKDDSKARKILKTALDSGKSIAIPLLVEYLKSELKSKGIFL